MSTTTAKKPDASRQAITRSRLLEAAAQEFAEHGFHHATVRDICRKADANVAAVNYHFGDKRGLYTATLKHWIGVSLEQFPLLMGVSLDASPIERLHGFILGTLQRMFATGSAGWYGQLMAREMVEPTEAFDLLVEETLRPMAETLHSIVLELIGPDADAVLLRSCAMSVIGQCCFYRHSRELVTRLFGDSVYDGNFIHNIADHVTRFSLAGLEGCRPGANPANLPAQT